MRGLRLLFGLSRKPSAIWCDKHWELARKFWRQNDDFDLSVCEYGMMTGVELFYENLEAESGRVERWKITPTQGLCCAFDDYTFNAILERSRASYGRTAIPT